MSSSRTERNKELIEYLNTRIKIQQSSLTVLNKLTKREPNFLLPKYMSKALQKNCKSLEGFNHAVDVIGKAMDDYSIDRIYYDLTMSSIKASMKNKFSLFTLHESNFLEANRHQHASIQREYDKRFGLLT